VRSDTPRLFSAATFFVAAFSFKRLFHKSFIVLDPAHIP
jgi:hypothetical protein